METKVKMIANDKLTGRDGFDYFQKNKKVFEKIRSFIKVLKLEILLPTRRGTSSRYSNKQKIVWFNDSTFLLNLKTNLYSFKKEKKTSNIILITLSTELIINVLCKSYTNVVIDILKW